MAINYKAKLDRIFSEYIRRRDSNEDGWGRCISCGKWVYYKDGDAGHYVNRRHMSLRYDEKNVNLQCRHCNRFDEGNMLGYHKGIVEKYGEGAINYLEVKKHNVWKFSEAGMKALIELYKQKLKEI